MYMSVFFSFWGMNFGQYWLIELIKKYLAECVFVLGTFADLGLPWINKYDNKTANRW